MPELPEVETVARQLAPRLVGRTIRRLSILDPLLRPARRPVVAGRTVCSVGRSGKQVLVELGPRERGVDSLWMAVHLRMTGRLVVADRPTRQPHLRARFTLDRGWLLFVDVRRFGTVRWHATPEAAAPVGIDPLDPALTAARLGELLGASVQNIKSWLLRQDRLVGLGNIYASEILHAARISPERSAKTLDRSEVRRLHAATRRILRRAIVHCGTTFSDFQDARGVEGSYQQYLAVYGRASEPCPRCGGIVHRIVQQQRSTFFCPACQD